MTDLWYVGDRNDVVEYLSTRGWATSATGIPELLAAQGLSLPSNGTADAEPETISELQYVTAKRN